jgi:CDP-paratose 2-epimerase
MSCIYGPRQFGNEDQGWVAHFALTGLNDGKLTIYGDGKQVRDLLYVDDLVDLMMHAISRIDRTAGEIYNVGGGPANTISIWVELQEPLSKLLGRTPKVTYDQFRPGDQRVYISDISRLSEHLGWSPKITVSDGLARMVQHWGPEWVATVKALGSAASSG